MTKSSMLKLGLFSLVIAVSTPISSGQAVSVYSITDLGILSPGTIDTRATAINNFGQVVGREEGPGESGSHGFVWQNGVITELPLTGYVDSVPRSINNNGTIVGTVDPTTVGSDIEQGFIWRENGSGGYDGTYYGDYPASLEKYFRDINDSDQIAGNFVFSRGATGVSKPYYWENGITTLLPTLGGDVGSARSINNSTQLVGSVSIAPGLRTTTAALWEKDINGNFTLETLGTFGGVQSTALGINNLTQVVGNYTPVVGQTKPYLWENGTKTDLGNLGGTAGNALSINDLTQIVGFSNTASNVSHAFLWENGQIFDLNSLLINGTGWELTQATGINDLGEIVGYGRYTDANGQTQTRAFIAQAGPVPAQTVPEPGVSGALFTFGLLGLMRRVSAKVKK